MTASNTGCCPEDVVSSCKLFVRWEDGGSDGCSRVTVTVACKETPHNTIRAGMRSERMWALVWIRSDMSHVTSNRHRQRTLARTAGTGSQLSHDCHNDDNVRCVPATALQVTLMIPPSHGLAYADPSILSMRWTMTSTPQR